MLPDAVFGALTVAAETTISVASCGAAAARIYTNLIQVGFVFCCLSVLFYTSIFSDFCVAAPALLLLSYFYGLRAVRCVSRCRRVVVLLRSLQLRTNDRSTPTASPKLSRPMRLSCAWCGKNCTTHEMLPVLYDVRVERIRWSSTNLLHGVLAERRRKQHSIVSFTMKTEHYLILSLKQTRNELSNKYEVVSSITSRA